MKLRLISVAFAAGVTLASAQDQPKALNLDFAGVPLRTVLQEVTRQSGVRFEAGQLGDRPIIARVQKMSAKTFLDSLATLLDAEWTRTGEVFTLSRENSRKRIAESKEAEDRIPWVVSTIGKELERSREAQDWSDSAIDKRLREDAQRRGDLLKNTNVEGGGAIEIMDSSAVTPATLVLNEALKKMPPKVLAGVLPNQRIVFATTPTRMQKALPYVPATLGDYVRAHNRLVAARKSTAGNDPAGVTVRTNLDSNSGLIDRVGKLIVIVQRHAEGLTVSALLISPSGDILDRPQTWLGEPQAEPGTAPADAKGEIVMSPDAKKVLQALAPPQVTNQSFSIMLSFGGGLTGSLGGDTPFANVPAEVKAALSDPVNRDPQSTFVAETFLGLAKERGKDLVAAIPDYAFSDLAQKLNSGKITISDLYRIAPVAGLKIQESDSILVSTSNHARADRTRVSRVELGKVIAAYMAKGFTTLDETCRYALAMPSWSFRNMDAVILRTLAPALYGEYNQDRNVYLKLYATLTPSQRMANLPRSQVPAMQMSSQQKAILEEIVYQPSGPMIIGNGVMFVTARAGGPGGPPNQPQESPLMQAEPTEAFPNGLPPNTLLQIQRNLQEGVFAYDEQGRGRFLSAGDLGLRMGFNSASFPGMQVQNNFKKYALADLLYINLTLQFGRRSRGTDNLLDPSIKNATAMAYDQLPSGFKDNVDKARQRAMNMKTMSVGGGGAVKPPE